MLQLVGQTSECPPQHALNLLYDDDFYCSREVCSKLVVLTHFTDEEISLLLQDLSMYIDY